MVESKRDRFQRLAKSRGDRLIREINLLGNLANTKNYEYDDEDVKALFEPIEAELKEMRARFDPDIRSSRRIQF